MLDQSVDAGMEIKMEDGAPVFENPYVEGTKEAEEPKGVFLKRTPQGLMRDDENGTEISSVFEIVEVGDIINHQTVIEKTDHSATVEYFDHTSVISNESEIFSLLIKDEVEEWIKGIKASDLSKMFEDLESEASFTLFRLLELTCLKVNMEASKYLYVTNDNKVDQRLSMMITSTLRRSFVDTQDDLKEAGVISFSFNYNPDEIEAAKKDIESRNGKYLYHISMFNPNNVEVAEGDHIIIC